MNRKTALATAAAVTMTMLSGVVALGAHTGALGIGGSPAPAVAQPIAAPSAAIATDTPAATQTATATRSTSDREHEREHEREYEGRDSDD
jgi:hypothetical protein